MTEITVIKHLFILGIISIILNSIFILCFFAGYTSIAVLYGILINYYPSSTLQSIILFVIIESFGIIISILCSILTLVGSCLGLVSDKKRRIKGIVVSIVSIWMLSIHFCINIIIMIVSFGYYTIASFVLIPIIVFQLILLIYNSIFVCVVGRSLRHVEDE